MALRTLYQTLLDADQARLRVIARQWGIELVSTRKPDLAAELVASMASHDAVMRVLEKLDPAHRDALDDLLRRGGAVPWAVFVRRAGEIRAAGPGRVEREELWREPISAAEALWYLGLVQRAYADEDTGPTVEMAFVPEDLALYIPDPGPLTMPDPPAADPPRHVRPGDDGLADKLVNLWSTLHQDQAPNPAAVANRLQLLEVLSVEQGWLRRGTEDGLRPVASAMLGWLQSAPWAQWATLARAWMTSATWHDLAHVPALRPDPVRPWPDAPSATRGAFLAIVQQCKAGTWYSLDAFRGYVKGHATDFLRPDGDYDAWAPRPPDSETPLRGFEAWDAVEGVLVAYLITHPMHWLGLVDLGADPESDFPSAFRLTAAGSCLLLDGDPPTFAEPPPVQLFEGVKLRVPRHRRYERFQLSRIADTYGPSDDGAYVYRLSSSSLTRAKRQRIPLARIVSFLSDATGQPLPSELRNALQRTYQGQETARLNRLWVLRVSDPAVLEDAEISHLVTQEIAPGVVAIREQDSARLGRLLLARGLLLDLDPM